MTTPFDYDQNPERFRLATEVTQQYLSVVGSLYAHLAELLAGIGAQGVLDIGCGEGALRAALPVQHQSRVVGLDASRTMLGTHPPPVVQAHAAALPFPAAVFDAAMAVNVFDHLDEPAVAIAEAHRVLVAGGLLIAATASRYDSPELAEVWRPPPSSFDAENAPDLMAAVFEEIQVERWDAPLVRLPDRVAVRDYLIARFVPPEVATDAAGQISTPAPITKRGALIRARKDAVAAVRSLADDRAWVPGAAPQLGGCPDDRHRAGPAKDPAAAWSGRAGCGRGHPGGVPGAERRLHDDG